MHATHEIMNYALRLIIRATSCTLRFCVGIGTERVAHPQDEARILVIEKAGEYLKIKSVVGVKHF